MKKQLKSLLLVAIIALMAVPVFGQAPSTEGRDFWVTFLRAGYKDGASGSVVDTGDPTKLTLTISARKQCIVTITNTTTGLNRKLTINPGNTTIPMINEKASCYSYQSEQVTSTAVHVTSTEDISLFAGNYRDKSFDAANIYPTTALLDDYLIQAYPPSAHTDQPQGSHFAIIATEDNTIVDYNLTAKTNGGKTGAQTTPTLNKGEVYYVWTGRKAGDEADLSGTTVKARNGKKIAVFQGCSHTNLPNGVRDRDHLFSQSMPTAYWGSEFGLTLSRNHRRDIIAVMAINDGTEVYINDADGEPQLVHVFNFNSSDPQERKHYWTFEIGDEEAYSTHNNSPYTGKLPEPLIADSSCFLTTSCPVGVHLFMTSNTYDEPTSTAGSIGDPAMLWISPIEQVIKEINFSTYADGTDVHFMNIVTTTADVPNVVWTDTAGVAHNLQSDFHPIMGNPDYSYARLKINNGSHSLKGNVGFLAHVYGFGDKCSYAYSCGSSTIQRSVTFNGTPLMIDSIYNGLFCVNEPIEMKLNIGNNNYQSIVWDYGDGVTYETPSYISNAEKKSTTHTYTSPGWYDLQVSTVYVNQCTGILHNEDMHFSFRVVRAETKVAPKDSCLSLADQAQIIAEHGQAYLDNLVANGETTILNPDAPCYEDIQLSFVKFGLETENTFDRTVRDGVEIDGRWYESSATVTWTMHNANRYRCDSLLTCNLTVITCLNIDVQNQPDLQVICPGENLELPYKKNKGNISAAYFTVPGLLQDEPVVFDDNMMNGTFILPTSTITKAGKYSGTLYIDDLYCDSIIVPVDFTVLYPSDIFKFKFNNVLAVYQNRGYDFTGYQWFCNGQPVEGGTESILYLGQGVTFEEGDEVFVLLTDKSGMTLPSCPQTLTDIQDYNPEQEEPAQAQKKIVNRRFMIQKGNEIYDIYGQKVE